MGQNRDLLVFNLFSLSEVVPGGGGGGIAQRKRSCFAPSHPGFDSMRSQNFPVKIFNEKIKLSVLPRLINGAAA